MSKLEQVTLTGRAFVYAEKSQGEGSLMAFSFDHSDPVSHELAKRLCVGVPKGHAATLTLTVAEQEAAEE